MEKEILKLKILGKEDKLKNLSTNSSFNILYSDRLHKYNDIISTNTSSKRDSIILATPRLLKEESNIDKKIKKINQSSLYEDPIKITNIKDEDATNYLNIENFQSNFKADFNPGPRFDSNNKIIPYSFVGSSTIFKNPYPYLVKGLSAIQNKINPNFFPNYSNRLKNCKLKEKQGDIVKRTNNSNIFENKNKKNDSFYYLPKEIKKSIDNQEKLFLIKEKKNRQDQFLERFLCEKTKKGEDQLLIRKNSFHLIKNAIYNMAEKKKENSDKGFINKWISSLRYNNCSEEKDISYINIRSMNSPLWSVVPQNKGHKKEIVGLLNENNQHVIDKLLKKKVIKKILRDNEIDIERYRVVSSLKIEGKNLSLEKETFSKIYKESFNKNNKEKKLDDEIYSINYTNTLNRRSNSYDIFPNINHKIYSLKGTSGF